MKRLTTSSRRRAMGTATVLLAGILVLGGPSNATAQYTDDEIACRATIGKGSARFTKQLAKTIANCHKKRNRSTSMAAVNCNDLDEADLRSALPRAEQKFLSRISSTSGRCADVSPVDTLYDSCPSPCNASVPTIATFDDVAACLACTARDRVEVLAEALHGTPGSPLSSSERRCENAVGSQSAKLFAAVLRDVTRCQAREEDAGALSIDFCTSSAFPSPKVEDQLFKAQDGVVRACDLESFGNFDSCAGSRFPLAVCTGDDTLAMAQETATAMLALPDLGPTTTTTTTTLPPADPQCPDLAELVLLSRDSNIPCATNGDCDAPRTCDPTIGICVSLSDLDSGWTGLAHDSDLDDGVTTLTNLYCPGPAPVCGECQIAGIDPSPGNCRCANDTRTICDEPFSSDADDCGGATCECYFGVPIPLSSAGTPACIVNRYSQDLTGTANLDDGSSEVAANLKTKVYLGITTTNPCPVCGGVCSNNPAEACVVDADCGGSNTCIQDIPNDGTRGGLCIDGANDGLSCDVSAINPSFPAQSGALPGGGGYSLDCLPSVGINISGAGLTLGVTQRTGTDTLEATLPCVGGNCHCKTCSASPQDACSNDSDCSGGSCAVSSSFACNDNADCSNLDLGACTGIKRCQLATSVSCNTNADCQNYTSGGPCNPSTCSALGAGGQDPEPNACDTYSCSDIGGGESQCTTGPDDTYCDGLVRANGAGILSCQSNADCTANDPLNGACTLVQRRACFPDSIVATGVADTEFPVGAAAFCVPPTSNGSINQVAGLPGPTRVVNQGRSRALCAGDHNVEYQAGIGGCP